MSGTDIQKQVKAADQTAAASADSTAGRASLVAAVGHAAALFNCRIWIFQRQQIHKYLKTVRQTYLSTAFV